MKRLLFASALAVAALAAAGCSGCSALNPNRAVLAETVIDEKALFAAEAAFFGAASAAEAAVDVELLQPGDASAVKIADALDKAHDALVAARAAYAVGDAQGYGEKIAALQGFVAEAWKLIPQREG